MPFIGKDWRSPGEAWVKTDIGSWERLKLLESSRHILNGHHDQSGFHSSGDSSTDSESDDNESINNNDQSGSNTPLSSSPPANDNNMFRDIHWQPPHCHVTLKSTKEVAGYNTISEAFYRLDFCNAIRDIRRFNYICKLLHLLITQNLTSLSGCATKVLFNMLEQVAWQVANNQQNIHILHTLLYDLKKIMRKYYCWGRPLGSTILWEQHLLTIERICEMAKTITIKQPLDDGSKKLTDLPEELIREILLRLSDYKDLVNSGKSYEVMETLLDEQHIWKQLCKYHFSRQQVRQYIDNHTDLVGKVDWEQLFHFLRKKFGLKEEYADCLFLCRHCRCLFWKSYGHPCITADDLSTVDQNNPDVHQVDNLDGNELAADRMIPQHIPVPPQAFLKFFSL